ncbi:hypothetical protein BT96DRAFT_1010495 [Gymnopus androsaceus JB14]|uniref:Uncharacterized protein n=1 Tax=Gymnopus androsaceus JB14 TaxID=1447944 RepID=A0A6A4GAM3_9AGAR|nr:hypothetical protein BT96DRAFT_1010495 [Gymnopus androsaceus JB14]
MSLQSLSNQESSHTDDVPDLVDVNLRLDLSPSKASKTKNKFRRRFGKEHLPKINYYLQALAKFDPKGMQEE